MGAEYWSLEGGERVEERLDGAARSRRHQAGARETMYMRLLSF